MLETLVISIVLPLALACWLTAVVSMFVVVRNRQPGLPLSPGPFQSPFNYVLRPASLTEKGLRARRWFFLGLLGFLGCIASVILLSGLKLI